MSTILIIIFIIILIGILEDLVQNKHKNKLNIILNDDYIFKQYLFTKTELSFYYNLKKMTDELNLEIFTKTRVIDLIEIKKNKNWTKNFNKLKAKHIDFIICKKNGEILTYIELDDYSHNRKKVIKRDELINNLFNDNSKHKIFRVKVQNDYSIFINELKNYLISEKTQ